MRRNKKRVNLHLDIAPINLIDLLLVLLIFFITTTSFLQLKVIELQLPQSSATKVSYKKDKMVVISLNTKCEIFINKEKTSTKELYEKLQQLKEKDMIFQIAADKQSRNYCMVEVLDALTLAKITKIGILTAKVH